MIGVATTCTGCGRAMHSCALPAWCSSRCEQEYKERRKRDQEAIRRELEKNKPPQPLDYQI